MHKECFTIFEPLTIFRYLFMSQKVLTFDLKTVSRVTRDMATFVSILGTLDIC